MARTLDLLLGREAIVIGDNSASCITLGEVPKDDWIDVAVVDLSGEMLRMGEEERGKGEGESWERGERARSTRLSCT